MRNLSYCRRTFIAFVGILTLGTLSYFKGIDVASPIAMIAVGLAGANAYEKSSNKVAQYKND